jgi:hypothetical protein
MMDVWRGDQKMNIILAVSGFNHLAKKFCGLCGLWRGGRIKSGIPLETRTNGIGGEEGRHSDLGGAEVDGEERGKRGRVDKR